MKSPEPGNKAQRKVEYKIKRNYEGKLSVEIITENYQLVYYHAKNVRFIGILAYPKIGNLGPSLAHITACIL